MKLRIIVMGRDRNDPMLDAADIYVERLKRRYAVEVVELKEEPLTKGASVGRVKKAEAERVRERLAGADWVVALDERGRSLSSIAVADKLKAWANLARRNISFVIGGPEGLDSDFVAEANEVWSLSSFTLPHRLARLVLVEQLYRASTILHGEPYHK